MSTRRLKAHPLLFVALALLLLLGGPLAAQEQTEAGPPGAGQQQMDSVAPGLFRKPGPDSPRSVEEVPVYVPTQERIVGRVSIPDAKLATLVQPEGRDWRAFRTGTERWIAGIVILGMLVLLTVFFLWRGTIRLERGRSGRMLPRFGGIERFTHWLTAASFIILALSGLVVTFGRPLLLPLMDHQTFTALSEAAKYGHNFTSVPFVLGLVLMLLFWIRDNIPERADWTWIRTGGGLLGGSGHAAEHPVGVTGRFNAGQKIVFWSVILGGGALAVTGFLMMVPFAVTGISGMQWLHLLHAVIGALMIAGILAHIYIGTVGMEGAFDAMGRGEVDETWAIEHHRGWYEAQRRTPPASDGVGVHTRPAGPAGAD